MNYKFLISYKGRVIGAADYLDEAMDFAERLAGPIVKFWHSTGTLFDRDQVTGYKVLRPAVTA